MEDGTLIMKKASGEILLMGAGNDKTVLDKEGKVLAKENFRFKLHYDLSSPKTVVTDSTHSIRVPIEQNDNS